MPKGETTWLQLSALIRNYGIILAVIFFPIRALSVEWIRFLVSFFGQDLQDYWPWLNTLRCSSKFNGVKIFFASGEVPLGRKPFYLNNPVNPV